MLYINYFPVRTNPPTTRLIFPIQRSDDNNIGRLGKEQKMSSDLEISCTTTPKKPQSLAKYTYIYMTNRLKGIRS